MSEEDIDYKTVVENLQHENERLRKALADTLLHNPIADFFKWTTLLEFFTSPSFIVGYVSGVLITALVLLFDRKS